MAKKEKIITFKIDEELALFIDKLPNKSEFIRHAIMEKIHKECPLCHGAGVIDEGELRHFVIMQKCEQCSEPTNVSNINKLGVCLDCIEANAKSRN
jgi:hypothetical protein